MSVFSNIFNREGLPSNFLDMFPDAVLMITLDGDIYKANKKAEKIFGLSKKVLCSSNFSDIVENGVLIVESILSMKKVQVGKAIVDGKHLIYLEINATMNVTSSDNKIILTIRDVTDDYIQNADIFAELEDFKNGHVDKNKFLVNLANEIQAPLHSALGFSQALLENLGGELSEKQQKYISIINKNNSELFSLLTKIINLSRYENSSIEVEFKNIDIVEFVQEILGHHRKAALQKNIMLSVDSEELLRRNCFVDVSLLKMAFNNILDLLIKNSSSGNLKVSVSTPSETVLNGMPLNVDGLYEGKAFIMFDFTVGNFAIPESEFATLFNPYLQAERENKKYVETSLSFAIAGKIAEFMRGQLSIEPNGIQGVSVKFVINLEQMENAING